MIKFVLRLVFCVALSPIVGTAIAQTSDEGKLPCLEVQESNMQPLLRIPPRIPARFLKGSNSGLCDVVFDVNFKGVPENIRIVQCSSRRIEQSSIDSVKRWKFKPSYVEGAPISMKNVQNRLYYSISRDGRKLPLPRAFQKTLKKRAEAGECLS